MIFDKPKTIEEARRKRYRVWAGNKKGFAYQEGQCAAEVADGGRSVLFHQCSRRNGHGVSGLYCKQHATD